MSVSKCFSNNESPETSAINSNVTLKHSSSLSRAAGKSHILRPIRTWHRECPANFLPLMSKALPWRFHFTLLTHLSMFWQERECMSKPVIITNLLAVRRSKLLLEVKQAWEVVSTCILSMMIVEKSACNGYMLWFLSKGLLCYGDICQTLKGI